MYRLLPLVLVLLAACGSNGPRYLLDRAPVDEAAKTRVKAGTLEVMDVSLPTYAEDAEIMVEDGNGALSPVKNALWADDPGRAITQLLVDQIGRTSTATTAAEPWPLESPPQAAVHVRVSEMVASASGNFDLRGQFAISSYGYVVRERIEPFAVSVSLADTKPGTIAAASSAALRELSAVIVRSLAR